MKHCRFTAFFLIHILVWPLIYTQTHTPLPHKWWWSFILFVNITSLKALDTDFFLEAKERGKAGDFTWSGIYSNPATCRSRILFLFCFLRLRKGGKQVIFGWSGIYSNPATCRSRLHFFVFLFFEGKERGKQVILPDLGYIWILQPVDPGSIFLFFEAKEMGKQVILPDLGYIQTLQLVHPGSCLFSFGVFWG